MVAGSKRFVRIDKKASQKKVPSDVFEAHVTYLKRLSEDRELIGGGFSHIDGGMIILEASDYEEAKRLLAKDPIIQEGYYTFDLIEWDIVIA